MNLGLRRVFGTHRRTRSRFGPALWLILWAMLAAASVSAGPTASVPSLEDCTVLELRLAGGWWVQIRRDRPAAYGFGALAQRVAVKEGTFALEDVYRAVIDRVAAPTSDAPLSDAAVSVIFSPMAPGEEGRVFALEAAGPFVTELFATAYRERDEALDDGFQQQAIRSLEPFWSGAPFLP